MTDPAARIAPVRNPRHFTRTEPVPAEGIERAVACTRGGELFRYGVADPEASQVLLLEREFAAHMGARYALGVNSCSSAIALALQACGARPGDAVLLPGFTFTAVPSAVVSLGLAPRFVEVDENFRVDLADLERKAPGGKILLLSHMRGHLSDMERVVALCARHGLALVEDAAHALGARWGGRRIGTFGAVGCYSAQAYKIPNAGEGGLLTTDDPRVIAEAIRRSGAYESFYRRHGVEEAAFAAVRDQLPIANLRMNEVTGAILRSQLGLIEERAAKYRANYQSLAARLSACAAVRLPEADPREERVPDSIQFRLDGFSADEVARFVELARGAGVPLSAFGLLDDNARFFRNWRYCEPPRLPRTEAAIRLACDLRLPCSLTEDDLDDLARVTLAAVDEVRS